MPRTLLAALAALLLIPATASARDHKPTPIQGIDFREAVAQEGAGPQPVLGMDPKIPAWLKRQSRDGVRSADHWSDQPLYREEQFQDQDGHVLTFATSNPAVDMTPFAEMIAGIPSHGDEVEFVHVYVVDQAGIESICGADAAACYAADRPGRLRSGVMILSYEDTNIFHAVVHEYGHHMDTNTYNLAGRLGCDVASDGSRRWFWERQVDDNILAQLTCDNEADWGTLLPEAFAEDFAQLNGIPRDRYHPAIVVDPPSGRQLTALAADIESPFSPQARKVTGRARRGVDNLSLTVNIPVFLSFRQKKGIRSVKALGCNFARFRDVFAGKCRIRVKTKRPRGRYSFRLIVG